MMMMMWMMMGRLEVSWDLQPVTDNLPMWLLLRNTVLIGAVPNVRMWILEPLPPSTILIIVKMAITTRSPSIPSSFKFYYKHNI